MIFDDLMHMIAGTSIVLRPFLSDTNTETGLVAFSIESLHTFKSAIKVTKNPRVITINGFLSERQGCSDLKAFIASKFSKQSWSHLDWESQMCPYFGSRCSSNFLLSNSLGYGYGWWIVTAWFKLYKMLKCGTDVGQPHHRRRTPKFFYLI